MRGARVGARPAFLVFVLLALVAAGFLRSRLLPEINSVSPADFEAGSPVRVLGRGFGAQRGEGALEIDGNPLVSTAYRSWADDRIEFVVPYSLDSGVVRVRGPWGRSNPEIIVSRLKTPRPGSDEARSAARPIVYKISPQEAGVGELLVIEGLGFGKDFQFSSVRFPRLSAEARPRGSGSGADYVEPQVLRSMYEIWDDKKIAVRVPEGAGSGALIVMTPQGSSEPVSFSLRPGSGSKFLSDPAFYAIQFRVDVFLRSSGTGEAFYVYLPDPPTTSSQSLDLLAEEAAAPLPGQPAAYSAYRFEGEGEAKILRTARLTVRAVETDLSAYKDGFSGAMPVFLASCLADEPLVPAAAREIQTLAATIVGRETNPQRKAALVWAWMKKRLAWDGPASETGKSALAALRSGRGDTRQWVLLACSLFRAAKIPAVPLSGFLAGKDGRLLPHSWLEYYLPSLGWIPFDPVLASGARPAGFDPGFEDLERYLGSLDNRHIAVTRGSLEVESRLAGSRLKETGPAWSLQTLYEEGRGSAATSSWAPPRLLSSVPNPVGTGQ